jgi:hypothetical protein
VIVHPSQAKLPPSLILKKPNHATDFGRAYTRRRKNFKEPKTPIDVDVVVVAVASSWLFLL